MGIKDFTKVFPAEKEINYKDLKGKNIALDASVELYRSALGMSTRDALTDSDGMPTAHINILLLGSILKLKAGGANQYWVFDYNQKRTEEDEFHNPLKQLELKKRQEKRKKAKGKIEELEKQMESLMTTDELFSSEDEDEAGPSTKKTKPTTKEEIQEKINKQEKIAFQMQEFYRNDLIFMLDMLEIPWVTCPAGFEAEQIAAIATYDASIFGVKMDYVFSPDVDSLLFSAKKLIKRDTRKKKLFEYDLEDLLQKYELSEQDLIKIGLILGTDFATKTPKIGPKTVLKKYDSIELSEEQTNALNMNFNRKITKDELKAMDVKNIDKIPFTNNEKYKEMLDWLELVKSFNRSRISKQFKKNKLFVDVD